MLPGKTLLSLICGAILLVGWISNSTAETSHGAQWSYQGNKGPTHWGDLKEEFLLCKNGKNQSPINITKVQKAKAPSLEIYYQETSLDILNNGHTIQFNYEPGSYIKIGEKRFDLLQFHFHAPSEHVVDGKPRDMEMHLVHKNDKGGLAVIGVFFTLAPNNPILNSVWKYLPEKINQPTKMKEIKVNAKDLLPKNQEYFFYSGSLTTPPCSEAVMWNVLSQTFPVTQDQLNHFKELVENNARPPQPLNKRKITKAE